MAPTTTFTKAECVNDFETLNVIN